MSKRAHGEEVPPAHFIERTRQNKRGEHFERTFDLLCLSNLCAFCSLSKIALSLLPVASKAALNTLTASSHSSFFISSSACPTIPHGSSGSSLRAAEQAEEDLREEMEM